MAYPKRSPNIPWINALQEIVNDDIFEEGYIKEPILSKGTYYSASIYDISEKDFNCIDWSNIYHNEPDIEDDKCFKYIADEEGKFIPQCKKNEICRYKHTHYTPENPCQRLDSNDQDTNLWIYKVFGEGGRVEQRVIVSDEDYETILKEGHTPEKIDFKGQTGNIQEGLEPYLYIVRYKNKWNNLEFVAEKYKQLFEKKVKLKISGGFEKQIAVRPSVSA